MKSFLSFFSICLVVVFCSCNDPITGPYTFENETGETLYIITEQNGDIQQRTLPPFSKQEGQHYYTPAITIVKDFTDKGKTVINNSVKIHTEGYNYVFTPAESYTAVIKCADINFQNYYILDSTQTFFKYRDSTNSGDEPSKLTMQSDILELETPAYSRSPSFVIKKQLSDDDIPMDYQIIDETTDRIVFMLK